jgi:hypothetical protein
MEKEIKEFQQSGITVNSSYEEFRETIAKSIPIGMHGYHSLLIRGLYVFQLMPYLAQWPKDQMKVLSIKDIKSGKQEVKQVVNQVFTFIKLPMMEKINVEPRHTGKYEVSMSEQIKTRLEVFYKPFNEKLFELLGKELIW